MNVEFLYVICLAIVTVLVVVVGVSLIIRNNKMIKTDNTMTSVEIHDRLLEKIKTIVNCKNQTTVSDLKENRDNGKLTNSEKQSILTSVVDDIMKTLGDDEIMVIHNMFGMAFETDEIIKMMIESVIYDNHNNVPNDSNDDTDWDMSELSNDDYIPSDDQDYDSLSQ